MNEPIRLIPAPKERPWGATSLLPYFDSHGMKIGELWYSANETQTSLGKTIGELVRDSPRQLLGREIQPSYGGRFPLLQKMIFTTERLSVQVHPDDVYAQEYEKSPGKTEMWYVVKAEPGAALGLGFTRKVSQGELREAAGTKAFEDLIRWVPVQAGESYLVEAGAVHAIGAGITICEIQQNSDVTYRLWDYGRPRELHLDAGLAVLRPHPWKPVSPDPDPLPRPLPGEPLASCRYFFVERITLSNPIEYNQTADRFHLLLVVSGRGTINGAAFRPGDAWLVPGTDHTFEFTPLEECQIVRSYVPPES